MIIALEKLFKHNIDILYFVDNLEYFIPNGGANVLWFL